MNSPYGRFGMNDSFSEITIFDNEKLYLEFENNHSEDINEIIKLDEKILVKHRSELLDQQTELYGYLESHNVSIAIASAITAYARIHMSQFKNNANFRLFYSDTDSIYIDRPLPKHLVNSKILGLMKLENILKKAIFLAPKVYYLETVEDKIIYKVKGLKHDIELTDKDFSNLLFKESILQKLQTK
jgi:DNA polymerase elongation subunit (family B)